MKKIMTALSIVLLLASCVKSESTPDSAYKFNWATVNFTKVEQKVFEIVEGKNPYPDSALNRRDIQLKRRQISTQITVIKRKTCSNPPKSMSRADADRFRSNCHAEAKGNPEVMRLQKQLQEVDTLSGKLSAHKQKVRVFAKNQASSIIQHYSDGKFDVVVKQRHDNIVHNKTGVALDITDAVMKEIDASKLTMQRDEAKTTIATENKQSTSNKK